MDLKDCIKTEIRVLESGFSNELCKKISSTGGDSPTMTTASFYTGASNSTPRQSPQYKPKSCTYCQSTTHSTSSCDVVTDSGKRLEIVRRENLCFNCLGRHRAAQCKSKSRCKRCKGKHHTSLCENMSQKDKQLKQEAPSSSDTQTSTATLTVSVPADQPSNDLLTTDTGCLLKTAVANVCSGSQCCRAQILFDEGAQRSFMTQRLARDLNIQPYKRQKICVSAFGGETVPKELQLSSLTIQTRDGGEVPISVLVVPKIAAPFQNLVPVPGDKYPYLRNLPLAHPVGNTNKFEISLLIGADFYWKIVQDKIIRGDGPTAVESKLGYLLSGPLSSHREGDDIDIFHVGVMGTEDTNITQFWDVEFTGTSPTTKSATTRDYQFLAAYLKSSVHQNQDGSYTLGFPWKIDHPPLPSNRSICERRTRSLARKLAQTPELLQIYDNIIADQVKRGFIERVRECDIPHDCHFIPHHAVKKQSTTTPVRIVYDCSCRQSPSYPSLNDCLQVGPPFLIDLCTLLLRFRSRRFALVTDIEKAFLHVHLAEKDRSYTHFLWLSEHDNPESLFTIYRFRVVLFGSVSSPFMLHAALQYHLTAEKSATASDILANLYVDNIVSGCSSEARALQYYKEARSLMSKANFNLRSWASNSSSLMTLARQDGVADNHPLVNVLGLLWDTLQDTISIKLFPSLSTIQPTKRSVLQELSKIFDPLGMLIPVTISAKLFMQQLWQQKLNWNQPITTELATRWRDIASNLQQTPKYVISRPYLQFSSSDQLILHGFVDASTKAYGAVTYLSHKDQSSFTMAKARVAPLKQHTLPRLELMAACIGARLCKFVSTSLSHLNLKIVMWSDSQITLHWLASQKKLQPFVANRVHEIHELLPNVPWQYCPTQYNPADLVTRGISYDCLIDSSLWKHGPPWLLDDSQWPKWEHLDTLHLLTTVDASDDLPNRKEVSLLHRGIGQIIDIQRYSKLSKLLRVSSYVLRFINNCKRHTASRYTNQLQPAEINQATQCWIRYTQQTTFPNEYAALQFNVSKTHRLPLIRQLRLFLNDQQIICCGGRIHNAMIEKEAKFPYLLPKKHSLTSLIVYYVHKAHLHAGVNATVTAMRQSYWIPSVRQIVKSLLRKCVTCRRIVGRAYSRPDQPPLPSIRTKDARPFQVTGVDFTGALHVKNPGNNKVYVCLFTCGVTRAVHLETVSDLSVETFLQALRRFVARRSLPQVMISDNASTYEAAANELEKLINSDKMSEALCKMGIQWKFIPKRAPWYGGFWERLIGLTKTVLRKVLGKAFVTLPVLQTLIVEVEAVLNDRPLTYVSTDLNDLEPLTPSHLLYGRRITSLPHRITDDEVNDPTHGVPPVREVARRQSELLRHFQRRWKREYLTSLRENHRTVGRDGQEVKVGDIVIIHDDTPRINWKLAVIEKLITGLDGVTRAAEIRTARGKTNRPITRLFPLEINENGDQDEQISNTCTSMTDDEDKSTSLTSHQESRPARKAAIAACRRVRQWTDRLRAAPEDVMETEQ